LVARATGELAEVGNRFTTCELQTQQMPAPAIRIAHMSKAEPHPVLDGHGAEVIRHIIESSKLARSASR
jgi:hypothetical protein